MPLCSPFTQRIAEFETALSQARVLLEGYRESGDSKAPVELRQRLASLAQEREEFFQEDYTPTVKDLLERWYNTSKDHPLELRGFLKIDVTGRVNIDISRDILFVPNNARYFPHLIKEVCGSVSINTEIPEINHLTYAKSVFFNPQARTRIMGGLEKIAQALLIASAKLCPSFPRLYEVGMGISIQTEARIRSFRSLFPQLKRVGVPPFTIIGASLVFPSGPAPISIELPEKYAHLRNEILRLQQEGSLILEGEVVVRRKD